MSNPEQKAIETIDNTLETLDQAARKRVLVWAWDKHVHEALPSTEIAQPKKSLNRSKKGSIKSKKTPKAKVKTGLKMVKDLNLRPKDKKSFVDFKEEKQPTNYEQKCTIATYYLERILGIKAISVSHIYTCFKDAAWRLPADLRNKLSYTSSKKALIDTSNMEDIKITTHGENLVEHDLPSQAKQSKNVK